MLSMTIACKMSERAAASVLGATHPLDYFKVNMRILQREKHSRFACWRSIV